MSKITIYPEEPCLLPVTYSSNPLSVYGKDYSDIEEVLMCFKRAITDAEDKFLVKYWKDGTGSGLETGDVLIDEDNNTFTLVKGENDLLPVYNSGYQIYIGVQVTGLSKMLWLRVNKNSRVIVEVDGIIS